MDISRGDYENQGNPEGRGYYENQECREPRYCCEEKKCVLSPNRTLLKCSAPVTTNIPVSACPDSTFNLVNLNIDTSRFHSPCIKFEFACNILTAAGSQVLNFQIFKQCKYQSTSFPIGPVWRFSRRNCSNSENDTFTFPVCDCDSCEGECCNYSVVVTVESLDTQCGVVISNATLSALVVDHPY